MIYTVQSTNLSNQTLDVVWVERIQIYQVPAPGLYYASLIGFHPRRLKASTGDELPRNGPWSMRNLLLNSNAHSKFQNGKA